MCNLAPDLTNTDSAVVLGQVYDFGLVTESPFEFQTVYQHYGVDNNNLVTHSSIFLNLNYIWSIISF